MYAYEKPSELLGKVLDSNNAFGDICVRYLLIIHMKKKLPEREKGNLFWR